MSKQKMMTLSMLAVLCVMASLSMHAKAQDRKDKQGQEGMTVVRDKATGKFRAATPEELRELRAKAPPPPASLNAAPQENRILSRRDGASGVRLGEKSLVYDVVTRGEDGKLSRRCVEGEAAADTALKQPANAEHKEHRHEAR